jgi:hypothetical protein
MSGHATHVATYWGTPSAPDIEWWCWLAQLEHERTHFHCTYVFSSSWLISSIIVVLVMKLCASRPRKSNSTTLIYISTFFLTPQCQLYCVNSSKWEQGLSQYKITICTWHTLHFLISFKTDSEQQSLNLELHFVARVSVTECREHILVVLLHLCSE